MLHKILVPLDGSNLAEHVFPAVIELAGAFSMEADIISVCETCEKEEEETSYFYINDVVARLKKRLGAPEPVFGTKVLSGKPSEQILRYAETANNDLIIMTSHGRSGITPWSLGSTVDKVFKRTNVPLIVVQTGDSISNSRLFRHILLPLDGSETSTAILPYIKELAERITCEVFLIKVVESGKHVRTIGGVDYVRFLEQDINSTKDQVTKYLEDLSQRLDQTKAKLHCEVRTGDPAQEILKYANETDCTLIAMTSHGHHGIEAWALGSVISKVVAASRQSLWMVPSFKRK